MEGVISWLFSLIAQFSWNYQHEFKELLSTDNPLSNSGTLVRQKSVLDSVLIKCLECRQPL